MVVGILLGSLIQKTALTKYVSKTLTAVIYALLFILGVQVGGDNLIMSSLHTLGLQALLISLAATLGSVLCAFFVYRKFFKKA